MRVRIAIAGTIVGGGAGILVNRAVRWWRTWGIDPVEATRAMPGDDLVAMPTAVDTRGMTIDAPASAIWPSLLQMGFDRAGWYSYDTLDMRGRSTDRLVPAWQGIEVGDVVPTAPGSGFEVRVLEPGRALTLYLDTAIVARQAADAVLAEPADLPAGFAATDAILRTTPTDFSASWTFLLEPIEGGGTRLIERFRARFGEGGRAFRLVAPGMGFGVFVMMRRQMLGIRDRAERTAVTPAVAIPPTRTAAAPSARRPAPNAQATADEARTVVAAATT